MFNIVINIFNWIREDWRSNPVRCVLEIVAWALSITCSTIMMLTVPTPPLKLMYPLWITQCAIFAWSSSTRKSFGLLANYLLLVSIDVIALIRLVS
jgi:hypothetical protein